MKRTVFLFFCLFLCVVYVYVYSHELGSGSGSSYPTTLDTDAVLESTDTYAREDVPNDLAAAILNVQVELGSNPAGAFSDVAGRLDAVAVTTTNPLGYQSYDSTEHRIEYTTDTYTAGKSSATEYYGDGSNLTGIEAGAGGIAGEVINFYIPGDAFVTTGIAYYGPLSYQITVASAMATVTADGTYPRGSGDLNFDIAFSSGIAQSTFETIFNSTFSLQMSSGTCWAESTDFRDTKLKSGYMIRLDIGEVCGTYAGGDPICVSLYGTQE